ncbi:MAG: rhodanese-like domain-containing protein [Oscillospiraceae bacterium]|nr:rhodanese-like domain-containing protein [Oscillospiraceae bacterium]
MEKVIKMLKKNWYYLAGGIGGGVIGFLYWYNVGCAAGTCPITSSPIMSTIWGALIGGLLLSIFFSGNKRPTAELKDLVTNGALLLDVRTKSEYAGGKAEKSTNIPLDALENSLNKFDRNQNIVVVCASGARSAKAVQLMKRNGFTNCYNGGSWSNFNVKNGGSL